MRGGGRRGPDRRRAGTPVLKRVHRNREAFARTGIHRAGKCFRLRCMPNPFQIVCALLLTAGGLVVWATVPDLAGSAVEKVLAGGMWSALAAFLVGAVLLGCWPRDAAGRLRAPPLRRR